MTNTDFQLWMLEHDLDYVLAAQHLGVEPRTVRRYSDGSSPIGDRITLLTRYYNLAIKSDFNPLTV